MTEEAKKKRDELAEAKRIEMELELGGSFASWCDIIFKNSFDAGYQVAMDEANERIKKLREALGFYAPADSYDYDKVQGTNYIWNDQGKTARAALKADEESQK